jgi:hypothetical protein
MLQSSRGTHMDSVTRAGARELQVELAELVALESRRDLRS